MDIPLKIISEGERGIMSYTIAIYFTRNFLKKNQGPLAVIFSICKEKKNTATMIYREVLYLGFRPRGRLRVGVGGVIFVQIWEACGRGVGSDAGIGGQIVYVITTTHRTCSAPVCAGTYIVQAY